MTQGYNVDTVANLKAVNTSGNPSLRFLEEKSARYRFIAGDALANNDEWIIRATDNGGNWYPEDPIRGTTIPSGASSRPITYIITNGSGAVQGYYFNPGGGSSTWELKSFGGGSGGRWQYTETIVTTGSQATADLTITAGDSDRYLIVFAWKASANAYLRFYVNSDTTPSNYEATQEFSRSASSTAAVSLPRLAFCYGASVPTGSTGEAIIEREPFNDSVIWRADSFYEETSNPNGANFRLNGYHTPGTDTDINAIQLHLSAGSFLDGSTFHIYKEVIS